MILRTKISIYRNIFPYNFTPKLNSKEGEFLIQKIIYSFFKKNIIKKNEIKKKEIQKLKNLDLIEKNIPFHIKPKYFYLDDKKTILEINSKEHLIINIYDDGGLIEKLNTKITDLQNKTDLTFSYSKKFGFLTSDINLCGYAKSVTLYIFIPSLSLLNKTSEISENLKNFQIDLSGFFYNPNPYGFFKLRFIQKENDDDFKKRIENTLNMILSLEEKESKNYIHKNTLIFKDKVSKSLGIFKNAYIITIDEYFKNIMYILWGKKEGIIIDNETIENKFFNLINKKDNERAEILKYMKLSAKI